MENYIEPVKMITGKELYEYIKEKANILPPTVSWREMLAPWGDIGTRLGIQLDMVSCTISVILELTNNQFLFDNFWNGMATILNLYNTCVTNPINFILFNPLIGFMSDSWKLYINQWKTCEATALTPPRRDPLVLDLDKDGGTSPSRRAYFDYDGDGVRELGSWFSSNDGLLAIDKNKDGAINDGTELFGDAFVKENGAKASNGMDALRDIDSNDDGVIDAQDEKFADLRIWKDANGDGVSQAEEIHTLEELGVVSLGTGATAVNQTDAFGDTQINAGAFTFSDGTEGAMGDWSLQTNHMATKYDYQLSEEQKAAIEGLPYIASVGGLRPLDYATAA